MRVTDRMIFDRANRSTQDAHQRVQEAVEQVSTGRRVNHPGDDPAAASLMVTQKMAAERMESIRVTTGRAADETNAAWDAINSLSDILARAKQLTIQMGNDTYSAQQRAAAATEVNGLIRSAAGVLNVQSGNRYIFGGNKDDAPPFNVTGDPPLTPLSVTYVGDAGTRDIEIAPGVLQPVAFRTGTSFTGVAGGANVFTTLQDLSAFLSANDGNGIRNSIGGLDQSIAQVAQGSTDLGGTALTLEIAQNVSLVARDTANTALSNLGDADLAQSATKLALANHALEAAISATAMSFQMSLVDKL
jgi:flagellar hook-associated protein 3 FlgL